jgi:hypothetical protein
MACRDGATVGHWKHIRRYDRYVLKNFALTIDENLLQAARKVASEWKTSVNQMVREYLEATARDSGRRRAVVGPITWAPDDVHER